MFDAVQNISVGYVLCGVIWALALGFAAGNYACSLVYRLPRGKLLLDKTPYCGNCGTLLKVKDLFPVVSAMLLRHRCRYCKQPFPVSHTWTELLVGLLFVLAFLQYNFSEQYILIVLIGVFLITLAAIHANEGLVMGKVLLNIVVFGALFRTLQDHSIYNFFQGALMGVIIGAVLWHKKIEKVGHIYRLPKPAELLAVGGLCVGAKMLPAFLVLYAGLYAVALIGGKLRGKDVPYTVPFGIAVMMAVMYPSVF